MLSLLRKMFGKPDNIDQGSIDHVAEYGWAVMAVHPSVDDPEETANFMYTINLDEHCGLPELIIFGIPQQAAHGILTRIVEKAEQGWRLSASDQTVTDIIDDGVTLELREVHPSNFRDHMGASVSFRRMTGRPKLEKGVQIFWPSKQGVFPWNWEDEHKWQQPLLNEPKNVVGGSN